MKTPLKKVKKVNEPDFCNWCFDNESKTVVLFRCRPLNRDYQTTFCEKCAKKLQAEMIRPEKKPRIKKEKDVTI